MNEKKKISDTFLLSMNEMKRNPNFNFLLNTIWMKLSKKRTRSKNNNKLLTFVKKWK